MVSLTFNDILEEENLVVTKAPYLVVYDPLIFRVFFFFFRKTFTLKSRTKKVLRNQEIFGDAFQKKQ